MPPPSRTVIRPSCAFTLLYALLRNSYAAQVYVDRELTTKTRGLLRESTALYSLSVPHAIHSLGAAELAALKRSGDSDTTKVLNLRKALAVKVQAEAGGKPFLVNIGERAETLAQAYEERQLTTQQVLATFMELAQQTVDADDERAGLGLDENAYAVFAVLRPLVPGVTAAQAQEVNALFAGHPDHAWDAEQGRRLRTALYKALRPLVGNRMTDVANTLLGLRRV